MSRLSAAARTRGDGPDGDVAVVAPSIRRRLEGFVRPFGGRVYCHAPMDRPFSYDALARPDDGRDRWGASGTRTVYLASDPAVATAEYARHRPVGAPADARCLCSFRLQAVSVLDLRSDELLEVLGRPSGAMQFLDREIARRVAGAVRRGCLSQGLIVPSMAYLDRPERFNVVLFAECLGVDLERLLMDRQTVGDVTLRGS